MSNQNGAVRNGKIPVSRVRLPGSAVDSVRAADSTVVRMSHSMSSLLAKRLRKLAYEQNTSESSIMECALWLFFEKGSDADVLRLMSRADIAPRRRRS
jgi:hypothetical protein